MARAAGLLNLLQGVVYGVLAGYFSQRWPPGTLLLGGAAFLQFAAAGLVLSEAREGNPGPSVVSLLSLGVVTLLIGLHLQVAIHIVQTFTPIGAKTGWSLMATLAAALPWVLFLPLWQWLRLRRSKGSVDPDTVTLLLLLLAMPIWTAFKGQPDTRYSRVDGGHRSGLGLGRLARQHGRSPEAQPTRIAAPHSLAGGRGAVAQVR